MKKLFQNASLALAFCFCGMRVGHLKNHAAASAVRDKPEANGKRDCTHFMLHCNNSERYYRRHFREDVCKTTLWRP
jgi:hypothetical protein